ncbi:MAG TPA: hypothetical protein VF050_00370, partial [Moraxellaceae bacterium]
MSGLFSRKHLVATVAVSSLVVFSAVFAKQAAAPTTYSELAATKIQARTASSVVELLDDMHYEHRVLNATLSSQVFDRYLKDLDGQHIYFLATDVQGFEPYRKTFENALKKGDLKTPFLIYNRYQQRVAERLNFVLAELERGVDKMDFGKDETLEVDREKAPWLGTRAELDELWRKRLKAAALSLRLAGKTDADIQKTLTKRYKSQLNNLYRTKGDDAFQVFMNSFTESYDPHTEYFSPRTEENFNINM